MTEKKGTGQDRTGQDNDSQKSHKVVIFRLYGEKPHCTDYNQHLHGG